MAHVEFLVGVGDPDDAKCRKPGDIVDLPEEQAQGWADGERAIARPDLDGPPQETTDKPPTRTPTPPGGPPRETTERVPAPERTELVPPPLSGRGSGDAAWAEFARAAGLEVAEATKRDEVQAMLVAAGISLEEPHTLPAPPGPGEVAALAETLLGGRPGEPE